MHPLRKLLPLDRLREGFGFRDRRDCGLARNAVRQVHRRVHDADAGPAGLTLIEKPDGSCIFLEDGEPCGCRINPVKPKQCDGFLSRWSFPGWEAECGAGQAMRTSARKSKEGVDADE